MFSNEDHARATCATAEVMLQNRATWTNAAKAGQGGCFMARRSALRKNVVIYYNYVCDSFRLAELESKSKLISARTPSLAGVFEDQVLLLEQSDTSQLSHASSC